MDKQADAPIAAQLAAAILGGSLLDSDRAHVQEQQAEAEAMNEAARQYEAMKMEQTLSPLDYRYVNHMFMGLPKQAALATAQSMDKVALGGLVGGLTRAAGLVRKGIGGAASAAGRLVPQVSTGTKLMGAGALLGAGYLGAKGLQATRDYMMIPSGSHHGPPIMNNVNEYGYPQY